MSTDIVATRDARARAAKIRDGIHNYLKTLAAIAEAWRAEDWRHLGYESWQAYVDGEFGAARLRLTPQHRQKAVEELRLAGLSTPAIAAAVGISRNTVAKDLAQVAQTEQPEVITGIDGKTYAARVVRASIPSPAAERTNHWSTGLAEDQVKEVISGSPAEASSAAASEAFGEGEALVSLRLTLPERRFLAMHARYESNHQDDPRYQHADLVERARLKARWREIADRLHHDPLGEQT